MPIYEYRCGTCGIITEVVILHSRGADVRECGRCGEPAQRVQFSRPGSPVFKGSGFYATDYKEKP